MFGQTLENLDKLYQQCPNRRQTFNTAILGNLLRLLPSAKLGSAQEVGSSTPLCINQRYLHT